MGLDVLKANNGQICLEKIDKYRPDIVFMDVVMPVMGGVEATKIIREKYGPDNPNAPPVTGP